MIELIGAPFDLCGPRPGSRLGPAAVRFANIAQTLSEFAPTIDGGDANVCLESDEPGSIRHFGALIETLRPLRQRVLGSLKAGHLPIMVGGDHSLSMASVSAAFTEFGDDLVVLWIDAHGDLNLPSESHSGNAHGMPIAALTGETTPAGSPFAKDWMAILDLLGKPKIRPDRLAWIGLRDLDASEQARIARFDGCLPITMHHLDRYGIAEATVKLDAWLRGNKATRLWISFDVDVFDPVLAPGTGTTVRGGLTFREGHLLAELLHELLAAPGCPYRLVGLDVVEVNPLIDEKNATATMAVDWLASLFGKSILGGK